jgi:hypothetical protein
MEARFPEFQNAVNSRPDLSTLAPGIESYIVVSPMMNVQHLGRFGFFPLMLGAVTTTLNYALKLFSSSTRSDIVKSYTDLGFESYDNIIILQ